MNEDEITSVAAIPDRLPFRLHDFTRLAWVSDSARDTWEPRIHRISQMLADLEWRTISTGMRDACLRLVPAESFEHFQELFASQGMKIVRLQSVSQSATYSAALGPCVQGAPSALWCAVGRDNAADRLLEAFVANDNSTIGSLLGYPSCCIKFFQNIWCDAAMVDTTWPMAVRSRSKTIVNSFCVEITYTSVCAVHLRWLGVRAVFHLPCAYDCEKSIALAKQHFALARQAGFSDEVDWLEQMVQWPVEWSTLHGIAEIRTPVVKIVARGDTTRCKHAVKYLGESKVTPLNAAIGVIFPFRLPILPTVTASRV